MAMSKNPVLLLVVTTFIFAACSSESGTPGTGADDTDRPTDAEGDGTSGADTGGEDADDRDTDNTTDGATRPDSSRPGLGVGELCLSDPDCQSALCFQFDSNVEEGFCTQYCSDVGDCPGDEFSCVFLANSGGDFARVCVPDDLCIDRDEDGWGAGPGCEGPDCDDANALIFPAADELCDGIDNDCDGNRDENPVGANEDCDTGFAGQCGIGRFFCNDGLLECVAERTSQEEVCDGVDNDCDGDTDENADGSPLMTPCYGADPATLGVGLCQAGTRSCNDGVVSECMDAVLPLTEICNGQDDNCDGRIDETDPGSGIACATGLPGLCAVGETVCQLGDIVCDANVNPGDQAERCNAVDDDCDGRVDEDFGGIGQPCQVGEGTCRRPGVLICPLEGDSEPICDATPGAPNPTERCDYADDDCDGDTDEIYRNEFGAYVGVENCGACGFDCNLRWPGGSALYNVVPNCSAAGATASCGFTCVDGWVNADRIADNGCEFRPESETVYVSTFANGGRDIGGCGAWDAPCASISGALDIAQSSGRTRVRVSTGLYRENITLRNGISVLGGHSNLNWVREPDVFGTSIRGAEAAPSVGAPSDRIVVTADGITAATEFSGFIITGVNAAAGGNSIGILVRNSNRNLVIQNNEVAAGAGGSGSPGAAGSPGVAGVSGGNGNSAKLANDGAAVVPGGAGGSRSCGGESVNGGAGGNGEDPIVDYSSGLLAASPNGPGRNGAGPAGGAGGSAGFDMDGDGSCFVAGVIAGNPGNAGGNGVDGAGGAGASGAFGGVTSGLWRGNTGSNGASGTNGSGGGGGGAPGGVDYWASSSNLFPGSGGGGGSGGCAGSAGLGGGAGGGSFAVFLTFTGIGPDSASDLPVLINNRLRRGLGGKGGDGGTGGGGGEGGAAGAGGAILNGQTYSFCLVPGSPGGVGGRGGHAGGGGGGAGGASFDIWVQNSNGFDGGYAENAFDLDDAQATGGAGGTGGNSSNTSIGVGASGVVGGSGRVREVP